MPILTPDGLLRREDGLKPSAAKDVGGSLTPDGLLRREDGLKLAGGVGVAALVAA